MTLRAEKGMRIGALERISSSHGSETDSIRHMKVKVYAMRCG
jgi:hypothetical protein